MEDVQHIQIALQIIASNPDPSTDEQKQLFTLATSVVTTYLNRFK